MTLVIMGHQLLCAIAIAQQILKIFRRMSKHLQRFPVSNRIKMAKKVGTKVSKSLTYRANENANATQISQPARITDSCSCSFRGFSPAREKLTACPVAH